MQNIEVPNTPALDEPPVRGCLPGTFHHWQVVTHTKMFPVLGLFRIPYGQYDFFFCPTCGNKVRI